MGDTCTQLLRTAPGHPRVSEYQYLVFVLVLFIHHNLKEGRIASDLKQVKKELVFLLLDIFSVNNLHF